MVMGSTRRAGDSPAVRTAGVGVQSGLLSMGCGELVVNLRRFCEGMWLHCPPPPPRSGVYMGVSLVGIIKLFTLLSFHSRALFLILGKLEQLGCIQVLQNASGIYC